jgi:tetratricopeptide (TPR) repeat protein
MRAVTWQDFIIIIIFMAVCTLIIVPACADTSSEIALSWVQKGDDFFLQERYNESLECYETAIGYDPYHSITWNKLGLARMAVSDYEGAVRAFNRSIDLDPLYSSPWNNKGDAFFHMGQYEEAIKSYDGALAINSNDLYALVHKGINLQESGHSDQAMKVYEEVILIADREVRKHPNDAKFDAGLWTNKGDAFFQLGRYEEAQESYETALRINPKFKGAMEGMQRIGAIEMEMNVTNSGGTNGFEPAGEGPISTSAPLPGIVVALAFGCAAALTFYTRCRNGDPPPR